MKKTVLYLLLLGVTACTRSPKITTGLEGKAMPSFDLLLPDSLTHINTRNIPTGKPVVLFYFGPSCPYSREEMENIIAGIRELVNIRFYVFTNASFPAMRAFYKHYELHQYGNIVTGIDSANFFGEYYKVPGYPYLAIFDGQKKLKQALLGKSDIGLLKKIASQ